ncbi:MAG: hypothetical protein KJ847_04740 [Firmicutes bacterium]|nr:hypothetical protein [Bacillota bacterium]
MNKKILILIRMILPVILNVLLFLYIYDTQKGQEYDLTNTFFYLGMINLLYGLGTLFAFSRSRAPYQAAIFNRTIMDVAIAEQGVKNSRDPDSFFGTPAPKIKTYIRLIYVGIGFLHIIAAVIVYSI